MKTDGKRVVSIVDGVLRVVDVASRKQTAVVRLDGENGGYPTQLLLYGDRALVMSSMAMGYAVPEIAPGEPTPNPVPSDTMPLESQLVLVDLTGAGAILATLSVDGNYLDARQVGSRRAGRHAVLAPPRVPPPRVQQQRPDGRGRGEQGDRRQLGDPGLAAPLRADDRRRRHDQRPADRLRRT